MFKKNWILLYSTLSSEIIIQSLIPKHTKNLRNERLKKSIKNEAIHI